MEEWTKYTDKVAFIYSHDSNFAGDKYVGEYKDGKRNGLGTFTFADGRQIRRRMERDDEYNGQGTYTFADGTKERWRVQGWQVRMDMAVQYSSDGSVLKEGIWNTIDEFQYAQNNPSSNSDGTSSSAPALLVQVEVQVRSLSINCFGAYNV